MDIPETPDCFALSFLPNFLTDSECKHLCEQIAKYARRIVHAPGTPDYCVASNADLNVTRCATALRTRRRIAEALGVEENRCEGLTGTVYEPGEYYKDHWDAFHEGSEEYDREFPARGQRTWTAMIYLNKVDAGGATLFPELGVAVVPTPGLALAWHNLDELGKPHAMSKHSSAAVRLGAKYVVTAWFRERP